MHGLSNKSRAQKWQEVMLLHWLKTSRGLFVHRSRKSFLASTYLSIDKHFPSTKIETYALATRGILPDGTLYSLRYKGIAVCDDSIISYHVTTFFCINNTTTTSTPPLRSANSVVIHQCDSMFNWSSVIVNIFDPKAKRLTSDDPGWIRGGHLTNWLWLWKGRHPPSSHGYVITVVTWRNDISQFCWGTGFCL